MELPLSYWSVIYLVSGVIYFVVAATFPSVFGKSFELLGLAGFGDGSGCPIAIIAIVLWPLTMILGIVMKLMTKLMTLNAPVDKRSTSRQGEAPLSTTRERPMPRVGNEQGVAETALRPGGKVRIGDEIYNATAGRTFIDKGSRVRVVEVQGTTLGVEKLVLRQS